MSLASWSTKPGFWPGFLLVLLLGACGEKPAPAPGAGPAATATPQRPALRYEEALRQLDLGLADVRKMMAQSPNDSLLALEPVNVLLERARLTGDYGNYVEGAAALAEAKRLGGELLYPCLASARFEYTLHRLAAARDELEKCPSIVEPADVAILQADLAFYSGKYDEAEASYLAAVNQRGLPDDYIRLGLLRSKTGSPGEAAALIEAAERRYHGDSATMRAWLKLQRGLVALDRGRHEEARAMYLQADRDLAGWWLVEEHIAEAEALLGNEDAARRAYVAIVERTGLPEFMDALAGIELGQKRDAAAQALIVRAEALYRERLAAFPEASSGHALDHFLSYGKDPAATLALAQANYRNRSYGDAAVALARALAALGRGTEAITLLERERTAGWRTPELLWVLGDLHAVAAQPEAAAEHHAQALQLNPLSARMYALAPG